MKKRKRISLILGIFAIALLVCGIILHFTKYKDLYYLFYICGMLLYISMIVYNIVKGKCPNCGKHNMIVNRCPKCGHVYDE